ncbi:MAG: hypothetical protein ACTTHG_02905 [Treponemataceae bacterium]
MEELSISGIFAKKNKEVIFEPFGNDITTEEVSDCLSENLYQQLSDGSDEKVISAINRAKIYIGTVLSYLGVSLNLDDKIIRQIVIMQSIYELHLALGHEEAGREYRIQAKNTIIAAYGSFPESDKGRCDISCAAVCSGKKFDNQKFWKAREFSK